MGNKRKHIVSPGDVFGRLTILKEIQSTTDHRIVLCRCECGKEKNVRLSSIINGDTTSCGCFNIQQVKKANTIHGKSRTRIHQIWLSMLQRCTYKNHVAYERYGGNGITICDEWMEFENFYNDMKDEYKDNLSIDRIDNSKGYCKYNCKWSTQKEQCNNRKNNRIVTYLGKPYTMTQLAEKFNIKMGTLHDRITYQGMTPEEAVSFVKGAKHES